VPTPPIHLQPTAPLADRALLPSDPGLALALAQALLAEPRMFNHSRGLWGYTGTAADGAPLTIQSTGIGGPSAAVVMEELCELGIRELVHAGTCAALDPGVRAGEVVLAEAVVAGDGASRALGAGDRVSPDPALAAALRPAADRAGLVASGDVFYQPPPRPLESHGALAADLEAAAILTVARRRGVRAASLLAVSHSARAGHPLGPVALTAVAERVGRAAIAALAPALG